MSQRAIFYSVRRLSNVPKAAFLDTHDVKDRLFYVLAKIPGIKKLYKEEIDSDANVSIVADIGLDSLQRRVYFDKLGEEFGMHISDTEGLKLLSLGSTIQYFTNHPKAR